MRISFTVDEEKDGERPAEKGGVKFKQNKIRSLELVCINPCLREVLSLYVQLGPKYYTSSNLFLLQSISQQKTLRLIQSTSDGRWVVTG